jgi:uncharacterized RmlC-like cupin family protein
MWTDSLFPVSAFPVSAFPVSANGRSPDVRSKDRAVVVVRPGEEVMGRQALPYFVGVSETSTGATGISMNAVVIPPGGAAAPHSHLGFETAVYMLKGSVSVAFGQDLRLKVTLEEGEFMFIPANTPHQPRNLSDNEAAVAVVARNDANEQENIERFA